MKSTIYEEFGGRYTQVGDYFLPDLIPGNERHTIGRPDTASRRPVTLWCCFDVVRVFITDSTQRQKTESKPNAYRVQEYINQCISLLRLGYIERPEALQEEADLFFADAGRQQCFSAIRCLFSTVLVSP